VAETKVTRITASDDAPLKDAKASVKKAAKLSKKKETQKDTQRKTRRNPFRGIAEYFKGAWYELKQVRWPTRGATWSLTLAVLAFTVFVGVLIVLLDLLFNYLFNLAIN
jgi:preprotein translocase SecE subunit